MDGVIEPKRGDSSLHERMMRRAISLSLESVARGGGPFGAVIVRDGEIIAEGTNRVTLNCDPTAHAEVQAIRAAAARLGTFDLSGCTIYTSCEPCPMCLGAIYWAHIDRMFYGNSKQDAAAIGFDDAFIYKELALPAGERRLKSEALLPEEAIEAFRLWESKEDRTNY
ncbi:MAG: nucleoside deaminase [Bacteroidaceae bacterium]